MDRNRLTVSQLNNYIKGVFDDELILKNITVFGEVFESSTSGGNLFLTLKDENSILRCIRFGGGFVPKIGDSVIVNGSVDYYSKGNRVSFRVRTIDIQGEGVLRREFLEMKNRLEKEGLFECKVALPSVIKKVGLVTSEEGAVLHDITSVLEKNHGYIGVILYPVKVQGEGAEYDIASAIVKANEQKACDVIVVARGGGANTDLAPFNTEVVARAVANSVIPIISAVGHQVDYTLCDFCSALRAGTPSIAAENICRINEAFFGRFISLCDRMNNAVKRLYLKRVSSTRSLVLKLTDSSHDIIYKRKNKIKALVKRMNDSVNLKRKAIIKRVNASYLKMQESAINFTNDKEQNLKDKVALLHGASPLKIISSGYAKVYRNGKSVDGVANLYSGDEVDVYMKDGTLSASVTAVRKNGE
ncbi:MAG: exodeoxyribonuclease VII large subunit [Clostridia bacterium]|nr:exodeoxyribonuclease VII large subunit [Clostridia bacterium]